MTHINAFYAEVDEKLRVVREAQAELETAQRRLEAEKIEQGLVNEPEVPKEEKPKDTDDTKKKIFERR